MKKALIIGAGFSGATAAWLLQKKGYAVTVLEGDKNPGGGTWTQFYGGHPYTFGPRIFFTWDQEVYAHMTSMVALRKFNTKTWTYVEQDSQFYHYPLQEADIRLMHDHERIDAELAVAKKKKPSVKNFESYWLDAIGPTLYEKFVHHYSEKMWGIDSNQELVADFNWVNKGTPIRTGDDRLYTDQFQGYPEDKEGYNSYFKKSLMDVQTIYECYVQRFDPETRIVHTTKGEFTGDVIINTIHIDTLFSQAYGKLRYCGRDFLKVMLPIEYALPPEMTWIHYSGKESFTRVTEFKKITGHQSPHTLLGIEIPSKRGRFYPVQSEPELKRFEQYKGLYPTNFFSIGRLGTFKYKGIEDAIREALDLATSL